MRTTCCQQRKLPRKPNSRRHCKPRNYSSSSRFHARPGNEDAVAETLREVLAPTRAEPGCRSVHIFRSTRDAQLFFLHSRWQNEAAFKQHLDLPHTVRFIARIEPLLDHPLDVIRTEQIG